MSFHSLVNTQYFSETAINFKKNGNRYTTAPRGSRDYYSFWEEEDRRCRYGYSTGGLWIPGRYYFYLNHFPILRVPDEVLLENEKRRKRGQGTIYVKTSEKIITFPKFWEIDYEWWMFKHISWSGGEFMGVKSEGGKHLCALKTRGCGFSYKEACDGVYNYNFIDGSKSYYFAASEPFLIGDAIMDKVQSGLDWINEHSPFWKKNRQKKFTLMHQKASYIDDKGVEKGSFSEIIAQIVDKASKTRGKRGRKITFEEAGSFPKLEDAVEVSLGSIREGGTYVGQLSVFGTGGEEGPGIQGLENIFNYPDAWDMLSFPNIWEDGVAGTECGYFVPCYRANSWFMDSNGNVDIEGALANDDLARAKKSKTGKPKDLDRRKAEYPRTPGEALQRINGNGFNIEEIRAQIKRVKGAAVQSMLRHGRLISSESDKSGVEFSILPKLKANPIEIYPHIGTGQDIRGCFTMFREPFRDEMGYVPDDMYFITFDAYYKDNKVDKTKKNTDQDLTSLFSFKVWKVDSGSGDLDFVDLPVAWYSGRPQDLDEVYIQLFNAAKLYNAKIQGEISGGGQGVFNYAKTNRLLHLLFHEPEMLHNKELASKSAGNVYLMNMNDDRKKLGLLYLEDWHMKVRGLNENGGLIYNIHRVYDLAWLMEMEKFNPNAGNYDRISDAIVAMFMLKEKAAEAVKRRRKSKGKSFYNRSLYGADSSVEEEGSTSSY